MTWIDLALLLVVVLVTTIAAEKRLSGLLVGLGGVLLLRPLLLLGSVSAFGALLTALALGVTLALLGARLTQGWAVSDLTGQILGGAGGLLLSTVLVLALVTALPVERNAHAQIVYPPQTVNRSTAAALQGSQFVRLGRNILLYPLLAAGNAPAVKGADEAAYAWLHGYLVVNPPWQ
jgi:hypothetical protein